jgi:hypothetical protein
MRNPDTPGPRFNAPGGARVESEGEEALAWYYGEQDKQSAGSVEVVAEGPLVAEVTPKSEVVSIDHDFDKEQLLFEALQNFSGEPDPGRYEQVFSADTRDYFLRYAKEVSQDLQLEIDEHDTAWAPDLVEALKELGVDTTRIEGDRADDSLVIKVKYPAGQGEKNRSEEIIFRPPQATRFILGLLGIEIKEKPDAEKPDAEKSAEEKEAEQKELDKDFEVMFLDEVVTGGSFESDFKITAAELESIPEYTRLSPGQKKLVYENFTQLTLGNVREEAARLYTEKNPELKATHEKTYRQALTHALHGIKKVFTKDLELLKYSKAVAKDVREGGFDMHRELISKLAKSLDKNGPLVGIDKATGEPRVDLIDAKRNFTSYNQNTELELKFGSINDAAAKFAKVPASWRGESLGVDDFKTSLNWSAPVKWFKSKFSKNYKQQEVYRKAESGYQLARYELETQCRKEGKTDLETAQILIGLDTRVYQLQTLQTSPEAVAALAKIENADVHTEAFKKIFSNGALGYMALGFAGRSLLGVIPGYVGAPLVSMGVAWLRSKTRTADELRERDRNARAGVLDTSPGALNVAAAKRTIELKNEAGEIVKYERGLIDKLKALVAKIGDLDEKIIQAEDNRDDELISYLNEKRDTALHSLIARIELTHRKMKENRINYGSSSERISNQTLLAESLGLAVAVMVSHVRLDDYIVEDKPSVKFRISRKLNLVENNIIKARQVMRDKHLKKSVLTAAGFSIAGASIAEYFGVGPAFNSSEEVASTPTEVTATASSPTPGASASMPSVDTSPLVAADGVVPAAVEKVTYTIEKDDNLTKILKLKFPDQANIDKLLLTFTKDDLEHIGLKGENINRIFEGEVIDIDKLKNLIEQKQTLLVGGEMETISTEAVTEATSNTESVPSSVKEIADFMMREKAMATYNHMLDLVAGEDKAWATVQHHPVTAYIKPIPRGSELSAKLVLMVQSAKEPPFNLVPRAKESISDFMERLSIIIAKKSGEQKLPQELQEMFNLIEQDGSKT